MRRIVIPDQYDEFCQRITVQIRFPDGKAAEIPLDELETRSEELTEVSRQTSVVTIDGAEVERIDKMVMKSLSGRTITFNFNNP